MKLSDLIQKAVDENENLSADEKKILLELDLDKLNDDVMSLRESLEIANGEKESALKQLADHIYTDNVSKIAADYKFSDKKYLEYLCRQNNIDCTDAGSFTPFMEELKKNSPKLFSVNLKAGCNPLESSKNINSIGNERDIAAMLKMAPELK